jgi:hypothetical protein
MNNVSTATKDNSNSELTMSNLTENNNQSKGTSPKEVKAKSKHIPKYSRPHMIIPIEDMDWAMTQIPSVHRLWSECWRCDPYGSRWMQLNTNLKRSAFMQAKKILEAQGLFLFKPDKSIGDGRETVCWMVQNLHGSRVISYWKGSTATDSKSMIMEIESIKENLESTLADSNDTETQSEQAFQQASVTSQKHLSNSSKELLRCDQESPAVAPLGGATLVDSQEEELDKRECGTTNSDFLHHTQEIKLTDDELKTHLAAAVKGVMPSGDVIGQLRDSDYWVCFRRAAEVHNWDLGQLLHSDVPAHLKEQMRSLAEKFKRRKF